MSLQQHCTFGLNDFIFDIKLEFNNIACGRGNCESLFASGNDFRVDTLDTRFHYVSTEYNHDPVKIIWTMEYIPNYTNICLVSVKVKQIKGKR